MAYLTTNNQSYIKDARFFALAMFLLEPPGVAEWGLSYS